MSLDEVQVQRAKEKIERCRANLLYSHPFWATIAMNLRMQPAEQCLLPGGRIKPINTMATDGTYLLYNPEFALSLTDAECRGVIMHETAHVALLHPYRFLSGPRKDEQLANVAMDAAVNALLLADGQTLPGDCVPPADLGETWEEIYDKLHAKGFRGKTTIDVYAAGNLGDGDGDGDKTEGNGNQSGQGGQGHTEQEWRDILAQNRGIAPAGIARVIQDNAEPRPDWRDLLAQFLHARHRSNSRTWKRLSKRVADRPGWNREPETKIAICVDTSGSIVGPQLDAFLSECKAICAISGISAALISCDAAVHQYIPAGDPWPTSFNGGGGTAFEPAIERALEDAPDAILYFTDGYGSFPSEPEVPILWCLTKSHHKPPYGELIHLEEN